MANRKLINEVAAALVGYGYTVYIAKSKEYGFYTDGVKVVSFGSPWAFSVDYSGNYQSKASGSGWQIVADQGVPTVEEAAMYIASFAPNWATKENVTYTTPEQYLKTYGSSSGFTLFDPNAEVN